MAVDVDLGPLRFTAVAWAGDDLELGVVLFDFTSGAVSFTGATITCTLGGTAMTVNSSTAGLLVCTMTEAQTTALGAGTHTWLVKVQTAGGVTTTYVAGSVRFADSGSLGGRSPGFAAGVVGNVLVAVR